MLGLIMLALLGLAVANDDDYHEGNEWKSMAGQHLDAQELRLSRLAHDIEELADQIHHDDDRDYNRVVHELEHRIESQEEQDCSEHQFSCGRLSGQCIADLLVCDGAHDCDNDHDEDAAVCENQAPAGRSWHGTVNWNSCVSRRSNEVNLLITGNRRMKHFPSRLWVDAVIIDKWTEDHEEHTQTWHTHGFFDYSHTRIVLDPPDGSDKRIGMVCDDAGEGIADCKMVRESDLYQCGHATLTREL